MRYALAMIDLYLNSWPHLWRRGCLALGAVLCIATSGACIELPRTVAHDSALPVIRAADYGFHGQRFGDPQNPPLIVIHGGPGADHAHLLSLRALADRYHVLFYDQRGTGLSPREAAADQDYSIKQYVADLQAIAALHGGGRPVRVIGHSWGGMLAIAWAARHPEMASHIVAAEPGALRPESWRAFARELNAGPSAWQILQALPLFAGKLFVREVDGHESDDYLLNGFLELGSSGPPYFCEGQALPDDAIRRAGMASFQKTVAPVLEDPERWSYDFTEGLDVFELAGGQLLLLSGDCSFIGYEWQERFHMPYLPGGTEHVRLSGASHYMFTRESELGEAIASVRKFLR